MIGEELLEPSQRLQQRGFFVPGELDQEQRVRRASDEALDGRAEGWNLPREVEHRAIDQLDRRRAELDDEPGHVHRVVEALEVADGADLVLRNRVQLQLDAGEEAECPFRADQQLRQVLPRLAQRVEVVAADLAQQLGDAKRNLLGVVGVESAHCAGQFREPSGPRCQIVGELAEDDARSVREHRLHLEHVVDHDPVLDRSRAGGVVPRHPADGGVRGRGDVDGKVPAASLELPIQLVEDDSGLHERSAGCFVDLQHLVHVTAGVAYHRLAQRLPVLRAAATSGDDGKSLLAGQGDGRLDIFDVLGQRNADGLDLVDGCVCRVAPAIEGAEEDVAAHHLTEARG